MPRSAPRRSWRFAVSAMVTATFVAGVSAAEAAPVLREARADIRFTAPTACDVRLTVLVDGAAEVTHRLDVRSGTQVVFEGVDGAAVAAEPADIGLTRALTVRPESGAYTLRYGVTLPADRAYRCPVWLPTTPADGRSRAVVLRVTLPEGATPSSTMPVFQWTGGTGEAVGGHLPAFVAVPFAAAGEPRPWDVSRVMDGAAIGTLVAGTLLWLRRARARRTVAGTGAPA